MPRVCSIEGCGKPHNAHGWCLSHYDRWRRHGDPLAALSRRSPGDPAPECSVEGCEAPARSKGMCVAHYTKKWKAEHPEQRARWEAANPTYGRDWYAKNLERAREQGRRGRSKRRARLLDAEVEDFCHVEIFERDRWVCGLCGQRVDPKLRHPHQMSASLDHIVPIALGGDHVRANVHLAHLSCNVRKRTRAVNEQLLLVG